MILPLCETAVCAMLVLSGAMEAATAQPTLTGYLSAYGESPTVGTVAYRQSIGDLPQDLSGYDALIAVADCRMIGKEGWLHTAVGALRIIVFDCAGNDGTPAWMAGNYIVGELDYWTWQRWPELVGGGAVLVMDGEW